MGKGNNSSYLNSFITEDGLNMAKEDLLYSRVFCRTWEVSTLVTA